MINRSSESEEDDDEAAFLSQMHNELSVTTATNAISKAGTKQEKVNKTEKKKANKTAKQGQIKGGDELMLNRLTPTIVRSPNVRIPTTQTLLNFTNTSNKHMAATTWRRSTLPGAKRITPLVSHSGEQGEAEAERIVDEDKDDDEDEDEGEDEIKHAGAMIVTLCDATGDALPSSVRDVTSSAPSLLPSVSSDLRRSFSTSTASSFTSSVSTCSASIITDVRKRKIVSSRNSHVMMMFNSMLPPPPYVNEKWSKDSMEYAKSLAPIASTSTKRKQHNNGPPTKVPNFASAEYAAMRANSDSAAAQAKVAVSTDATKTGVVWNFSPTSLSAQTPMRNIAADTNGMKNNMVRL